MTTDQQYELNPQEVAEFRRRLAALSIEETQALLADPAAQQQLAYEARLAVAMEGMDADQLMEASNQIDHSVQGPLFSDAEWALIFAQPKTRHLATDATARTKFEYLMRQDPEGVKSLKRAMADIQSDRDSSLSPMAKQWIWRIAIGLVVGGIALAASQR